VGQWEPHSDESPLFKESLFVFCPIHISYCFAFAKEISSRSICDVMVNMLSEYALLFFARRFMF